MLRVLRIRPAALQTLPRARVARVIAVAPVAYRASGDVARVVDDAHGEVEHTRRRRFAVLIPLQGLRVLRCQELPDGDDGGVVVEAVLVEAAEGGFEHVVRVEGVALVGVADFVVGFFVVGVEVFELLGDHEGGEARVVRGAGVAGAVDGAVPVFIGQELVVAHLGRELNRFATIPFYRPVG